MQLFDIDDSLKESLAVTDIVRSRSWQELQNNVFAVARLYAEQFGLLPGDHIALHIGNRVEFIEALLAGIVAGLWVTPVNTHLTRPEALYILKDCSARLLVHDSDHTILSQGTDVPALNIESWRRFAPCMDKVEDTSGMFLRPDFPSGGTMLYTSGTTGKPKGVMRAKPALLMDALSRMKQGGKAFGLSGVGPHLVTGPLYHAAPMLFALYDLLNGAPVIIMKSWDEKRFTELVTEFHVTTTHLVPTMMVRLLKYRDQQPLNPDLLNVAESLKLVLHGAAPVAPHTKAAMLDWWGDILVEYWGGSEAGVTTLVKSAEWRRKPGTVGKPLPHFRVYVGDDSGNPTAAKEGQLYCCHQDLAQVFSYHNDPDKTRQAHPKPHVFSIGDRGYVDDEGFVYLSGRMSNMIISGGVNIYPAEVEHAILEHPMVQDCAVIGVPDPEWGEQVHAVVELVSGDPEAEKITCDDCNSLRSFLQSRLARFKIPRHFHIIEAIPRMPTGKVRNQDLFRMIGLPA